MNTQHFDDTGAVWIWPASTASNPNQYVQFRQEFALDSVSDTATLHISIDTDYAVWINGQLAGFGQYDDYPECKTYDSLSVAKYLRTGRNTIAVLGFYQGVDSFQYIVSTPGLVYALETAGSTVCSGTDTQYRVSKGYKQGKIAKVTGQLGFTFEYRASVENPDWRSLEYKAGSDWRAITAADTVALKTRPLSQTRPIEKLNIGDRLVSRLVTQGLFKQSSDAKGHPIAEQMQTAHLQPGSQEQLFAPGSVMSLPDRAALVLRPDAARSADGVYLIFDLGREEAGQFDLELNASEGTIIDVAWGEHLEDGHVRASVGSRCFASRYVCCEGQQSFTHYFLRMAGRYIQLHISRMGARCEVKYAGLLPVAYPVEENGSFRSSDEQIDQIYQTSIRTLELCMHEHYEDCPWREQALYAMDMRNQALCGYTAFGDPKFPAASLELLGMGLKADGYLELCAPAEISITIPCFSMAWVIALADHLMYTGDLDFARRQMPRVKRMLESYHVALDEGLLQLPIGKRYWHFYEWADGLDGAHSEKVSLSRRDAPLNLFYSLALEAASKMAHYLGDQALSDDYSAQQRSVNKATHRKFWDPKTELYRTYSDDELHYAELTQSLALLAGVVSDRYASGMRAKLVHRENGMVRATLSYSIYKYEALLQQPDVYGLAAMEDIRKDWAFMLSQGATSFWETIKGAADFGDAGSLCHGWSGIPVYFWHAYILGVKPLEPGFKRFSFIKLPGFVTSAEGRIATPYGTISVKLNGTAHDVVHPAGTQMIYEGKVEF